MALKGHANFQPKLNPAFQISTKEIGQFVPSGPKGSKVHILLFSFVLKVNCLNQKTFTGVLFCDMEGPCKLSAKTEFCFPNQQKKNWSICFQQAKRVQVLEFIAFISQKGK